MCVMPYPGRPLHGVGQTRMHNVLLRGTLWSTQTQMVRLIIQQAIGGAFSRTVGWIFTDLKKMFSTFSHTHTQTTTKILTATLAWKSEVGTTGIGPPCLPNFLSKLSWTDTKRQERGLLSERTKCCLTNQTNPQCLHSSRRNVTEQLRNHTTLCAQTEKKRQWHSLHDKVDLYLAGAAFIESDTNLQHGVRVPGHLICHSSDVTAAPKQTNKRTKVQIRLKRPLHSLSRW